LEVEVLEGVVTWEKDAEVGKEVRETIVVQRKKWCTLQ
jgi:hypothetical protein